VGQRLHTARVALERPLDWLAEHTRIPVPELQRLEAGECEFRPAQLSRIASALALEVDWFVSESPPAVRSLRASRIEGPEVARIDLFLDTMARDVELLRSIGTLQAPQREVHLPRPQDGAAAETCARTVRTWLGGDTGPLLDLDRAVERLGVHTLCVEMTSADPDGAYVALDGGGVVVLNGAQAAGRRRFTLAHELGHHVFHDEYSTDRWQGASRDDVEKLIDAFAIHLLLPREALLPRWTALRAAEPARAVALRLAVEFRVSWTAMCAQCERLGLIGKDEQLALRTRTPTRADFLELGLRVHEELRPPTLSPGLSQAVLAAYRKNSISADRAVEMLRGTVERHELPPSDPIPLEAYASELDVP